MSQALSQVFIYFFQYNSQMNKFTDEVINIDDYEDENNEKTDEDWILSQ